MGRTLTSLVLLLAIGTFLVITFVTWLNLPSSAPPSPEEVAAAAKARREAAELHAEALEPIFTSPMVLTDEPCPLTSPRDPGPLGNTSLAWPRDQAFGPGSMTQSYLMYYLRLIGSDFEVAPAPGSGAPVERVGYDVPAATLIIDRWQDPVLPEDPTLPAKFTPGYIEGRLLLWDSAAGAFVCGAKVSASNIDVNVVSNYDLRNANGTSREDSLSKVRIDLLNEAIRAGLAHLRRLDDASSSASPAQGRGRQAAVPVK